MHTIKLPAQPYQLKNGSYVSHPLNGADADINSLLSFLKTETAGGASVENGHGLH